MIQGVKKQKGHSSKGQQKLSKQKTLKSLKPLASNCNH